VQHRQRSCDGLGSASQVRSTRPSAKWCTSPEGSETLSPGWGQVREWLAQLEQLRVVLGLEA
jgi:hypothetical protein